MSVHQTKVASLHDAALAVTMRDASQGVEGNSGITVEFGVNLQRMLAPWNCCAFDAAYFQVEFDVHWLEPSGSYALIIFECDANGSPLNEVARIPSVTATGSYRLSVPAALLNESTERLCCACEISNGALNYSATLKPTKGYPPP